jgi:hypothetical protein
MVDEIKKIYGDNSDLIIKKISAKYTVIYFESICSSDRVNEFITKPLIYENKISAPHTIKIKKNEVENYLNNAFAVIIKDDKYILASEVRADLARSIDSPETQPAINGPKDAFTENIQLNLGLIKRRIKTKKLKIKNKTIGKYTNTLVQTLYIEDNIDKNTLKVIENKINEIKLLDVIDSSNISNSLQENMKNNFPTIMPSERPDEVVNALVEGKVVIIVDNSPFALILPSYFTDFINPVIDRYSKALPTNFVKIIRYICLVITLVEPAFYIATLNYNQETIPTSLLINFMIQREGVPFPSVAEALIMLIIYEILRESDIRFPSKYGTAISILGALILGEAAVNAGIVSPIMIITIAMCFISSLIFTNPDFSNALRLYRFLFLFGASLLGLYGILLVFLFMLINLCSTYSINKPYTIPIAPFKENYFSKYIWRKAKK